VNVLFVHFVVDVQHIFSHAVSSLAGAVAARGNSVQVVTVETRELEDAAQLVLSKRSDVVCMSATTLQWPVACALARWLKKLSCPSPLWVGGAHMNARPADFFQSPFDAACYGEGDEILPEAITALSVGHVVDNGAWLTKHKSDIPVPTFVQELDSLQPPILNVFPPGYIIIYPSVMFSRGCPYSCSYCMSRLGGIGGRVRWKSVATAIEEARQLAHGYQPQELYIDDDTFLKHRDWVIEFLERYENEVRIPFFCNARPETVSRDICERLAKAGCRAIGIGVESGSEKVRRHILRRPVRDSDLKRAFVMAHDAGLRVWSFNMLGIPGETVGDLKRTIAVNEELGADYLRVSVYTPYGGTPLGDSVGQSEGVRPYFDPPQEDGTPYWELANEWCSTLRASGRLWND
jgi:anaerobic magnesium-protoporphyrin IX monomethyl ester cyclase